ncbi:MAG: addiction module protein [Nannocystaceae bacterium]
MCHGIWNTLEDEPGSLSPELTAEVHSRIARLERGEVKAVPWSEAEAQLRRTLERLG